jgi:hypothetical protein
VLAGRSLRETERRIHQIGKLSIAALAFSLFVSLGVVALVEAVSEKRKKRAI